MFEYGQKIEEKVKTMQVKYRKNVQEPTVDGKKPRFESTVWMKRKK